MRLHLHQPLCRRVPTHQALLFVGTVSQFGYQLGTSWVPVGYPGRLLARLWNVLPQVALQNRLACLQYNGGPDNVAAGEFEGTSEKREAIAIMNGG